jgi:hypothetical protein
MDATMTSVAVDYINEIRHHLDTGDIVTAAVIVDLLEDIINPGSIEWKIVDEDNDDDICDAFGYDDAEWSTVIDSTCDYCSERSDNVQPVINSMFWACESCMGNSVV